MSIFKRCAGMGRPISSPAGWILLAVCLRTIGSMKTTFDISEPLLREVQQLAAASGTTTKSIVEQALIRYITERRVARPFVLADLSVPGQGLQAEYESAGWPEFRDAAYGLKA